MQHRTLHPGQQVDHAEVIPADPGSYYGVWGEAVVLEQELADPCVELEARDEGWNVLHEVALHSYQGLRLPNLVGFSCILNDIAMALSCYATNLFVQIRELG